MPKGSRNIFLVRDKDGNVVRVVRWLNYATKVKPAGGSVTPITPFMLELNFGANPLVRAWLKNMKGDDI